MCGISLLVASSSSLVQLAGVLCDLVGDYSNGMMSSASEVGERKQRAERYGHPTCHSAIIFQTFKEWDVWDTKYRVDPPSSPVTVSKRNLSIGYILKKILGFSLNIILQLKIYFLFCFLVYIIYISTNFTDILHSACAESLLHIAAFFEREYIGRVCGFNKGFKKDQSCPLLAFEWVILGYPLGGEASGATTPHSLNGPHVCAVINYISSLWYTARGIRLISSMYSWQQAFLLLTAAVQLPTYDVVNLISGRSWEFFLVPN